MNDSARKLNDLREALAARGLDGMVVPHADEHLSEFLPASAEQLAWLTGFTGSAGTAVVLRETAVLMVDGRYTLQAAMQSDTALYEQADSFAVKVSDWIKDNASEGQRIGYDPWLTSHAQAKQWTKTCGEAGIEVVPLDGNPIDTLWTDRPDPPKGQVVMHPVALAGEASADKIERLRARIARKGADTAVLTQPDSIAWTFNLRGGDIDYTPLALAHAILPADGTPELFIDPSKLSNSVRAELAELADIQPRLALDERLRDLGRRGQKVLIDPSNTVAAIAELVTESGGSIRTGTDPVSLPKARKNETELAGARAANRRDGAAVVRFLAWLDRVAASGEIDEIAASDQLEAFRRETAERDGSEFISNSFPTISGAGSNGAIIHYRASPESSKKLTPGNLYLCDSGAQYRDGTTDITRTIAIGEPSDEMRDRFTRVLKGHIGIATARFPVGTSGAEIDTLARAALWQGGFNFAHGTGHGIGSFLAVHEGPANISKRGTRALDPGMILSNEPGYYKAGAYGIRTENLLIVRPAETIPGGDHKMLSFETITLAPIDRRLIDPDLMNADEIAWLDAYHASLPQALNDLLDDDDRAWLAAATQPLAG